MTAAMGICLAGAMGICLAGCQEDALVEEQTQTSGVTVEGEIVFSTSGLGSFNEENPQSRTVYGQGYEEGGKWNCPVNWITGDQVRIYYPNASSPAEKYADYEVTWDDTNKNGILDNSENDAASLVKIGEPLCWGDGTEHAFYGFYPASVAQNSANPAEITGEIPMLQEMKEWKQDGNGNWTGEPDMNYAFMRAVTTVSDEGVGEPVSLRFEPLTTAISGRKQGQDGKTVLVRRFHHESGNRRRDTDKREYEQLSGYDRYTHRRFAHGAETEQEGYVYRIPASGSG